MREQDGPAIADPFVEVDCALGSFGCEIGSFIVYAQHFLSPGLVVNAAGRSWNHCFIRPSRDSPAKRHILEEF
jgi:hypothetical protein